MIPICQARYSLIICAIQLILLWYVVDLYMLQLQLCSRNSRIEVHNYISHIFTPMYLKTPHLSAFSECFDKDYPGLWYTTLFNWQCATYKLMNYVYLVHGSLLSIVIVWCCLTRYLLICTSRSLCKHCHFSDHFSHSSQSLLTLWSWLSVRSSQDTFFLSQIRIISNTKGGMLYCCNVVCVIPWLGVTIIWLY